MGFVFICRVCSRGAPNNVCAHINRSTANPYYIVTRLKCPMGVPHHKWEYTKEVSLHIPVNFKVNPIQSKYKKELET